MAFKKCARDTIEGSLPKKTNFVHAFKQNTYQKALWLFVLLLFAAVYYFWFERSVISPQTGWWQYFAWRMSEGDLLYKDIFLYIPPYFPFLTSFLYQFFSNHFIYYTVFGFLFFRVLAWSLVYLIATRITKPQYAAVGVMLGICITSAYLVDQLYDYNPMIMMLIILQAYLFVRYSESEKKASQLLILLAIGAICGIYFMTKQNVGLVMPFVSFVLILMVSLRLRQSHCLLRLATFVCGFLIAVVPGVIYLLASGTLDDCLRCIWEALGAKMGESSIIVSIIQNCISVNEIILAGSAVLLYLSLRFPNKKAHKFCGLLTAIFSFLLALELYPHLTPALIKMRTMIQTHLFLSCVGLIVFLVALLLVIRYTPKKIKSFFASKGTLLFWLLLLIMLSTAKLLNIHLANGLYITLDFYSIKTKLLYVVFYLFALYWLYICAEFLLFNKAERKGQFLYLTIFMAFMAVSFASATLEELYALIMFPSVLSIAFNFLEQCDQIKLPNLSLATLSVACAVLCLFCFAQKLNIPYSWHSWTTASLLDPNNPVRSIDVNGLEGFLLPASDAEAYEKLVSLIEENSSDEDTLYQFPNIMLFNVLTERKTVYAAVPYFDVCPDSIAAESASQLEQDLPELVLWAELPEWNWQMHESIFRGGLRSGQRDILDFYQNIVQEEYTLLGEVSDTSGNLIRLWKHNK